jgi:uncharacterized protein (TIGR02231 family)
MKHAIVILAFITLCSPWLLAEGDSIAVPAVLESAIVYRSSAELIHSAQAELIQGNNQLIINDISNSVDINSVRISCSDAVTILSVEFSKEYLRPELPYMNRLTDSAEKVKKELGLVRVQIQSDNELLDLLRVNREIRGTQIGVNVSELMKMIDYYKRKNLELQYELNVCKNKEDRLNLIIDKIKSEMQEEEKKNTKTSGRLTIQLLSISSGKFDFNVSYLTSTAHWNPFYELRIDHINEPLKLLYKAKLVQTTGINWKKVKLSLSTSAPNQQSDAPVLKTWFLHYPEFLKREEYASSAQRFSLAETVIVTNNAKEKKDLGLGDFVSVNDNELNVTFDIDLPYDVPSNGKEQQVVLKEYSVPALYKYHAVPKINADAFLFAEVPGWEKLNLLPGEASIVFEGTYTGKSYIDPNSTLDTLNLTLGIDKRVVVTREKITDYSSIKFLGANKKQFFTYEITVKNNKKQKLQMLLTDQYPISTNKEIESELLSAEGAIANSETGLLSWKLELAPGESKKYRVSYSIKYPRDKQVNIYN